MTTRFARPSLLSFAAVPLALLAACSKTDGTVAAADRSTAGADLLDRHGKKVGGARLRQTAAGVEIEMEVSGLTPGVHALHIHTTGDCHTPGPDGTAFAAAGAHFNPFGKKHGLLNPEGPHAGDLPNLDVPSNGRVDITLNLPSVTLREGRHSLLQKNGTSFVIHANPDDGMSDPAGNSGARIACGVIRSLNAPGLETR